MKRKTITFQASSDLRAKLKRITEWHELKSMSATLRVLISRESRRILPINTKIQPITFVSEKQEALFDGCLYLLERIFGYSSHSGFYAGPDELTSVVLVALNDFSSHWDRGAQVLRLRYGLDETGQRKTLQQVAELMGGLSRDRVRQLESKAFRMLRHPSRVEPLREVFFGPKDKN